MSEMAVHYYSDDTSGVVYMHFSGNFSYNTKIHHVQAFQTALAAAKQIPDGKRKYDPTKYIWTFDSGYFFNNLLPFYDKNPIWYELRPFTNYDAWRRFIGEIVPEEEKKKIKADDPDHVKASKFFHNFNTVVEQAVNTRDDKKTLVELTGVPEYSVIDRADSVTLKKLYRQTAIKLHPDKNGGDHTKMSTFTQLWGIYVQPRT